MDRSREPRVSSTVSCGFYITYRPPGSRARLSLTIRVVSTSLWAPAPTLVTVTFWMADDHRLRGYHIPGIPIYQWADPAWGDLDLLNDDPRFLQVDPWNAFLPLFRENDVVVVCSAGNTKDKEPAVDTMFPRRHARPGRQGETSLIVVGGSDQNGFIWDEGLGNPAGSNTFTSIITAFAPASRMDVANAPTRDKPGLYDTDLGTSLSAGIVTGLVATFLDRPDLAEQFQRGSVASAMKSFLHDVVAPFHTDVKPNAVSRVGTYNYVPCPEDGLTRRVGAPIRRPPNPAITNLVSTSHLGTLPRRLCSCRYCQYPDD